MITDAIKNSSAITTIVGKVAMLGQEYGKYGSNSVLRDDRRLVNEMHLTELEDFALRKVQEAAKKGTLLQTPNLSGVLYCWNLWSPTEAREWFRANTASDTDLVSILTQFVKKGLDLDGQKEIYTNSDRLQGLCDSKEFVARITNILTTSKVTPYEQLVLERFLSDLS